MVKYLCVLFIMVIALPYCAFALVNGDFESGTVGQPVPAPWYKYSSDTLYTDLGARTGGSGTKIAKAYNPAGGGSIYQTEVNVPSTYVGYPQTWTVIGWVRLVDDTTNFSFGWFGSLTPYSPAGENITTPPALGNWAHLVVTHTWSTTNLYTQGWRDVQINYLGHIELDDWVTYPYAIPVSLIDFSAEVSKKGDWCFE